MSDNLIAWVLIMFACFTFTFTVIAIAVLNIAAIPLTLVVIACMMGAIRLREK